MHIAGVAPTDPIGSLLRSLIEGCEAVRLVTHALRSWDFIVELEIASSTHVCCDSPISFHVVRVAFEPLEVTITSAEIRLRSQYLDGSASKMAHRRTREALATANHQVISLKGVPESAAIRIATPSASRAPALPVSSPASPTVLLLSPARTRGTIQRC